MIEFEGRKLSVTDGQIHIWHNEGPANPWPPERRAYAHRGGISPTVDELIIDMDAAGVDRAILVPPSFGGDDNDASLDAAARFPDRFAVMGRVAVDAVDRPDIATWTKTPGMIGIRLTFHRGVARGWLTDGTADWLWAAAENAGVPIMIFSPERVGDLIPIVERHPGLRVIIDHAGLPTAPAPLPMESIIEQAVPLARFANVAVKASAFPCALTEEFPFPTAQRATRTLIDAYGPERVFWGTDLTRLPCSYAEAVGYLAASGDFTVEELELVMGTGIQRWLGWML